MPENLLSAYPKKVEDKKIILLWENSNPTSSFPAQFISLDFKNSDFLLVVCNNGQSFIPRENPPSIITISCGLNAAAGAYQSRAFSIKENGIQFYNAAQGGIQGNDAYAIPLYIYGIKY